MKTTRDIKYKIKQGNEIVIWSHFFREQSFYLFASGLPYLEFTRIVPAVRSLDPGLLIAIINPHFFKIGDTRQKAI